MCVIEIEKWNGVNKENDAISIRTNAIICVFYMYIFTCRVIYSPCFCIFEFI